MDGRGRTPGRETQGGAGKGFGGRGSQPTGRGFQGARGLISSGGSERAESSSTAAPSANHEPDVGGHNTNKKARFEGNETTGGSEHAPTVSVPNQEEQVDQNYDMYASDHFYQENWGGEYYNYAPWAAAEDPSFGYNTPYNWGAGAFRGQGYGRGRGYSYRGRGRGLNGQGLDQVAPASSTVGHEMTGDGMNDTTHVPAGESLVDESTLAAAEASPSPLVAATFGDQFAYTGRGFPFRGRGFRGRGRGRGGPGRTDVAAILASKSWTRAKATEEPAASEPS